MQPPGGAKPPGGWADLLEAREDARLTADGRPDRFWKPIGSSLIIQVCAACRVLLYSSWSSTCWPCCWWASPPACCIYSAACWTRRSRRSVYLVPVVISTLAWGLGPGIVAALAAFFAFNYFFIEPRFTLLVRAPAGLAGAGGLFGHRGAREPTAGPHPQRVERRAAARARSDAPVRVQHGAGPPAHRSIDRAYRGAVCAGYLSG